MSGAESDDVAIIGMACRFPGASNYEDFWSNLVGGVDAVREVPSARWDWQKYFGDPNKEPGKTNVRLAGFIDDIDKLDAAFFSIPPKEAEYMDPQHRIFLECVWHAIEDAGYRPSQLANTRTGVYCGVTKNDYAELMREHGVEISPFVSTGTVHSIITNRVSFFLNLRGPSEIVNTACSSSLVALSRAVADLRLGRCETAIVGGVNAMLSPTMTVSFSRSGMLATDGKIKAFDKGANGFVRGEGVGALLLKPLRKAQSAGDSIWAVIKGVGVNHGGRAPFLTSPRPEAQAEVVSAALEAAQVSADSISFVECHGTGTRIGDPIEIAGLKTAFRSSEDQERGGTGRLIKSCALGSVKPNIGHLESAAGIAGIIKVALAMRHRMLPGQINFTELNPFIDLDETPFYVLEHNKPWGDEGSSDPQPLRAGVSSFGMGGVNAHVVLEAYRDETGAREAPRERAFLIPLSTKRGRLTSALQLYYDWLLRRREEVAADGERLFLRDLAFTLRTGRDPFDERVSFVAGSVDELLGAIRRRLRGEDDSAVFHAETPDKAVSDKDPVVAALQAQALAWVRDKVALDVADEPDARRLRLPGYPFERRRYWYPNPRPEVVPTSAASPAVASPGECSRRVLKVAVTPELHRQHRVRGQPLLPASAHFELVRALVASPGAARRGIEFSDVYWLKPWPPSPRADVSITLTEEGADRYAYSVHEGATEYVRGRCRLGVERPLEDRPFPAEDVRQTVAKPEFYRKLYASGLEHGPSFQVIETMHVGARGAVARARSQRSGAQCSLALDPYLIDGAFQVATQLSLTEERVRENQHVPFYLESATFYDELPDEILVDVAVPPDRGHALLAYDMRLRDPRGEVVALVRGFKKRGLRPLPACSEASPPAVAPDAALTSPSQTSLQYYTATWRTQSAMRDRAPQGGVVVCASSQASLAKFENLFPGHYLFVSPAPEGPHEPPAKHHHARLDDPAGLRQIFEAIQSRHGQIDTVLYLIGEPEQSRSEADLGGLADYENCLALAKGLILSKPPATVRILCSVVDSGDGIPVYAGLAGFARTLAYEYPKISMQLVVSDDPHPAALAQRIDDEIRTTHAPLRLVSYHQGQRRVGQMLAVLPPSDRPGPLRYRDDGVVLIFGGAGGLGRLFASHIAAHSDCQIVLLGRRPLSLDVETFLRSLNGRGRVSYESVDVTDAAQVRAVIGAIRSQRGKITGVLFAAGVIEDDFVLRKQLAPFRKVLATKIAGCINVDLATQQDDLDYFVAFSSVAALMPNHGQVDYASGNSFLDAYMARRNEWRRMSLRKGASIAINWPLWKQGGMGVSEQGERHFEEVFGMKAMDTGIGLALIDNLVSATAPSFEGIDQIVVIDGDREKVTKHLHVSTQEAAT